MVMSDIREILMMFQPEQTNVTYVDDTTVDTRFDDLCAELEILVQKMRAYTDNENTEFSLGVEDGLNTASNWLVRVLNNYKGL